MGKSEALSHGNTKPAILADSVEALIAAIYFDGGLEEAEKFIITNLKDAIEESSKNVGMKDHKTILQEKLQEHGNVHISYEVIQTIGPDHDKTFIVEVSCDGTSPGSSIEEIESALEYLKKWIVKKRLPILL